MGLGEAKNPEGVPPRSPGSRKRTLGVLCSSAGKNLTLNTKLLFLPPELVRYVLIHELCHTVHLNHSKDFWRLVACLEPGYGQLDEALRGA